MRVDTDAFASSLVRILSRSVSVASSQSGPIERAWKMVIGVTVDGHRDILGIRAGDGDGGGAGEGAKYWLQVLTEIKSRGVADACIVVCDGLKGLPESITTV